MKRPSVFGLLGGAAVIVIVIASLIVRTSGPADPAADVGEQRADVERFHDLVRAGRWADVYRLTSQPPGTDATAFAKLMREQVREHGKTTAIATTSMRLLRSRPTPMLEVHETVTIGGERKRTISYFTRDRIDGTDRWLFAFSAAAD